LPDHLHIKELHSIGPRATALAKRMDGPVRQLGSADGMPVLGMMMMLTNP
jgi:hypothetical protein